MYSDRKRRRPLLWVLLALLVLAILIAIPVWQNQRRLQREESAAAIQSAVRRSALQCYVTEGVYPPSLEYLEENYGLRINRGDYYVVYEAFASNLPPTVRVVGK